MLRKGYKHTKEHIEKNRLAHLGKKHSKKTRRNIARKSKGNKSRTGMHNSIEMNKKISKNNVKFWLNKQRSKETRDKISKTNKEKGIRPPSRRGKKHSEETKRKMSESHKGEKAYQWLGGKSFEPYTTDWTKTLKRSIRERDKYTCQICGKEPAIQVHHIDYNKNNCNPDNLITLCCSCHGKTNHNRNYWIKYFKKNE